MKYQVIYADPPWKYKSNRAEYIANNSGETGRHYPTMSIEELLKLKVKDIAHDNSMLFLWATFPFLQESLLLIKEWGFVYKTVAFSWVKTVKDGSKPAFGVGYYTRSNVEVCLLGVRGKALKERGDISSVVIAPREQHSKKPDIVREKIELLTGDVSRIELFARNQVEGWHCWGNEVISNIQL